jgi:hypothetical protein
VDKKSNYPVNTSAVFPNEKVCVWNVSFALPESMRKNVMMMVLMGILLNLRKLMGKQFYIILPLCLTLPDGTLACKAANKFMLQK